ncbi:hypothetical protein BSAF29S_05046 [Bacillus safensis subsp. safensis]
MYELHERNYKIQKSPLQGLLWRVHELKKTHTHLKQIYWGLCIAGEGSFLMNRGYSGG